MEEQQQSSTFMLAQVSIPLMREHSGGRIRENQKAEYEKIKRMTFPLEENYLLLVTAEVDADHNKIIRDILTMLS
jgi:hypothetical protein